MADPVTLGVIITGLVGAYKAYAEYKAAVAGKQQAAAPAKSAEIVKGEQIAPLVNEAVQQHGDAKEQTTLALFADDPNTYREALQRTLISLAERNPAFAQQLQTIAQQANIQTGGVQGSVIFKDNAKSYGPVAVTNEGTITTSYSFKDDDDAGTKKG